MISLKELTYVDAWSRKAPYPGKKYAMETLETMKLLFEKYNQFYKNKDYSIIFSDATEVNFEILDCNICHMLGVDHKNLFTEQYETFIKEVLKISNSDKITTYEIISRILQNYEEVVRYDGETQYRALNYYKSRIKCAIFEKLNEMENFNFGKLDTADESKILYFQSNEAICPYFLVRLSKNEKETKYGVSSLLAPKSSEIKKFFEYTSAIPTQMIIDDDNVLTKIEATPKDKINLLNLYKSIIASYSLNNNLDISGDYLSTLATLSQENSKQKSL